MSVVDSSLVAIQNLQPTPLFAAAFQRVCRISDELGQLDCSKSQLSTLFELICEYSWAMNAADMSDCATQEGIMCFESALDAILSFIEGYKSKNVLVKLWHLQADATCIENFLYKIQRTSDNIKISVEKCVEYEQKLPACRQQDKADLDHILELALQDLSEAKVFQLVDENCTSKLDALDHLRKVMTVSDGETRKYLDRIMNIISQRVRKVNSTQTWAVNKKAITMEKLIGAGVITQIYKGTWNGRTVAIKLFDIAASMSLVQEEARRWSQLHHPNLLEMYGASQYEYPAFMVLPFCIHGNVNTYIRNNPEANRLALIVDVTTGLEYLHSIGICHHELKANNVMVDDNHRAKITDFLIADVKMGCKSTAEERMFAPDSRWLSPERISEGVSTEKSDVYSLGVTIWEIITGEIPWFGHTPIGIVRSISTGRILELPSSDLASDNIRSVLHSCWSKEPSTRPEAKDVAAFFRDFPNSHS